MQKHIISDVDTAATERVATETAATERAMAEAAAAAPKPQRPEKTLVGELCALLVSFRPVFGQERVYQRMVALLFAKLACVGRQTVTQLLLALGQLNVDWSAMYRLFSRGRVQEEALFGTLMRLTLAHVRGEQPYVVVVDGTHIPRSSKKMPGCGWMRAPGTAPFMRGIQPGQRFEHCAWLTPIANGYSRAIPIRFLPAPPASAVKARTATQACSEWQAALIEVQWVRKQLDEAERKTQQLVVLGDGNYDTVDLWKALPERTVLVVRTAKNRCLRGMPVNFPGQRGPTRKYGPKAPQPQAYLQKRKAWKECNVHVRGRDLRLNYQVAGPFVREGAPGAPLFLLVVQGASWKVGKDKQHKKVRDPAFFLVSALQCNGVWRLPLPVATLLAWTWQRWEVEVAHREMKSGLGAGEMQCWNKVSALLTVQWCVWVYALVILAAYRCWGMQGGPAAPGKWRQRRRRRWSLNTVWRTYRQEIWTLADFPAGCMPSPVDWHKIEQKVALLVNGTLTNGVT